MSRIRSIHPGLWTDEAFMRLSAYARLLYIGLWNEAFDDGVFEWKPLTLKAKLFPVDNVDVPSLLKEIEDAGSIDYRDDPKPYGLIRNFRLYQRPKKPNSSGLLKPEDEQYVGVVRNQFRTSSELSPQMEDGGGREGEDVEPPVAPQGAGGGLFEQFWEVFPRNPQSNEQSARRAFEALKDKDKPKIQAAAVRFRAFFVEQAAERDRSFEEHCDYAPKADNWLKYSAWKEADQLPVKSMPTAEQKAALEAVEYVDRVEQPKLFEACERVREKPAHPDIRKYAFPREVVEKARATIAA